MIFITFSLSVFSSEQCAFIKSKKLSSLELNIPKKNQFINLKVDNIKVDNFYCMKQKEDFFLCVGDDDSGKLEIWNDKVKIHYLSLGNPDKKMFHYKLKNKKKIDSFKISRKPCSD